MGGGLDLVLITPSIIDVSEHYDFKEKVINFVPPQKLKEIIDFTLPSEGSGIDPDLKCKLACLFPLLAKCLCFSLKCFTCLADLFYSWLCASQLWKSTSSRCWNTACAQAPLGTSISFGLARTLLVSILPSFLFLLFHPCVALSRLSQVKSHTDHLHETSLSLSALSAHTLPIKLQWLTLNSHRMQALSLNGCPHSLILRLTPMKLHLSTHCMSPKFHFRDEII